MDCVQFPISMIKIMSHIDVSQFRELCRFRVLSAADRLLRINVDNVDADSTGEIIEMCLCPHCRWLKCCQRSSCCSHCVGSRCRRTTSLPKSSSKSISKCDNEFCYNAFYMRQAHSPTSGNKTTNIYVKKLTSLQLCVKTMWWCQSSKTAKVIWVTLDGAMHMASLQADFGW